MGSRPAAVDRGVGYVGLAREYPAKPGGDVRVVVEAHDRVRLWQRLGELAPIAFGQAADGDHGPGGAITLQLRRLEECVDRVLLRGLHEPAGVHDDELGGLGLVDEQEATHVEPGGELLGVDVVARTAQRDHRDCRSRTPRREPIPRRGTGGGHETGSGRRGGGAVVGGHRDSPVCRLGRSRLQFPRQGPGGHQVPYGAATSRRSRVPSSRRGWAPSSGQKQLSAADCALFIAEPATTWSFPAISASRPALLPPLGRPCCCSARLSCPPCPRGRRTRYRWDRASARSP